MPAKLRCLHYRQVYDNEAFRANEQLFTLLERNCETIEEAHSSILHCNLDGLGGPESFPWEEVDMRAFKALKFLKLWGRHSISHRIVLDGLFNFPKLEVKVPPGLRTLVVQVDPGFFEFMISFLGPGQPRNDRDGLEIEWGDLMLSNWLSVIIKQIKTDAPGLKRLVIHVIEY